MNTKLTIEKIINNRDENDIVFLNFWKKIDQNPHYYVVDYLKKGFIDTEQDILLLPGHALDALKKVIDLIESDRILKKLFLCIRQMIFIHNIGGNKLREYIENIIPYLGSNTTPFILYTLISGIETTRDYYNSKGIDEEILKHTLEDLRLFIENNLTSEGLFTQDIKGVLWLVNHFTGKIFRLGRLQYEPGKFINNILVYKNNLNGEIAAVSENGIECRGDGQIQGTADVFDADTKRQTVNYEKNGFVYANLINPEGYITEEIVKLNKTNWSTALKRGNRVLYVHIPEGGKMSHELCRNSIAKACDFFPRFFNYDYKAFVCNSWLLGPYLKNLLPENTNIIKFQREFHLYPIFTKSSATLKRVFGKDAIDVRNEQGETKLQRAIISYISAGNHVFGAGGFILGDDVRWGQGEYRRGCIGYKKV